MKITFRELLERVAEGTQPDKIKYFNTTYVWNGRDYVAEEGNRTLTAELGNWIVAALNTADMIEFDEEAPVREGMWLKMEGDTGSYYCSVCQDIWGSTNIKNMKYCPSCGSKMTGVQE